MSTQPAPIDPRIVHSEAANSCPHWCAIRHRSHGGADDHVHVSSALLVNRTVLRLAASFDPDTGAQDGPVVYVGEEEYTLYQAEVLIDALMQLVDHGTHRTALGTSERSMQDAMAGDDVARGCPGSRGT